MIRTENFAKVEVDSAAALQAWLSANHAQTAAVWLVTFKVHVPARYVPHDHVLDALIAFGWIDGIRRMLDADRTMQLIAPRKMQVWAKTYKDRAARLISDGRMHPAGLAAMARSQAAGLWDALDHVDALLVPDDLAAALADQPTADAWFHAAAPSYRRNVLRWVAQAKTPPTRAKRIATICDHAALCRRVPQF
jgi:uncharacterized protein YdeI (YjbR/CyaY-like superfamily)